MRRGALWLTIAILTLSCGSGSSPGGPTPQRSSPSAPAAASASASPSSNSLNGTFGLLLSAGTLFLINPDATEAASVSVAAPSVQSCGQGMAAVLQPPVSASDSQVYFRDGDTKIRMVVPPSSVVDVTTVPGDSNVISFFSVSPDDKRIAVLVEDMSAAAAIKLRLYVEDLRGGGHHAEIFTSTVTKGKGETTLWPMGWHQGQLVLAVWPACTFQPVPWPGSWHLVDASTAARLATIGDGSCAPSNWPSPSGAACFEPGAGRVRVYDWTGKQVATVPTQNRATELSPSGRALFAPNGGGLGNPAPTTSFIGVDGNGSFTTTGHMGCLWIDDSHVLAQDAIVSYPAGAATALAQSGQCAGRFPGSL
jgi:hypothetical protein